MFKRILAVSLVTIASLPIAARADLILGTLNATGTANVSLGNVGFLDNELFINSPAAAQTGGFTALEGSTAVIKDLTNPPDAVGPLNIPDFITFADAPNISITLTFLLPGVDGAAGCSATPPAAGQFCTPDVPALSPYNLFNSSSSSSTASFNVLGLEVDSLTGDTIPVVGAFSEPFTALNFQQILAEVESGGTVTTAFGAQFVTTPEPSTEVELMIGFCAVGIGLLRRMRFKI
jgi:hypothetical protein